MTETPPSPQSDRPLEAVDPTRQLPVPFQPPAPTYGAGPAPYGMPYQQAPYQQPPSLPIHALPAGPVLVAIGDISVEQHRIVTPAGVLPTHGANWSAMDMSRTEEKIPTWAVVCAIVFTILLCLFGLLFLLCKDRRTTGFVQITLHNGNRTHNTLVAVSSPAHVADTLARVNFARSLCF